MKYFITLFLTLGIGTGVGFAQNQTLDPLSAYIDTALQNNLVLKQKNVSFQQAQYALKEAKGMFLPTVAVQANYVAATGGRDIPLPLGDLLNGVYSTLNELTQTHAFPQLENEKVNFLPHNFYDAKIHTTVPIYNSGIIYNRRIKSQQVQLSQYEIEAYQAELVKEVKEAYYNYLQAGDAVAIYTSALDLADEGKRVNERLLTNGKGLPAYVIRAESEIESVTAQLTEAQQNVENAQRYFNFLLNRGSLATIDTNHGSTSNSLTEVAHLLSEPVITENRVELKQLNEVLNLQDNVGKLRRSAYYPSLNGFVDLGSQAENWKFNGQSRYYMAGLQLDIPIFKGNQTKNQIKQADLAVQQARLQLDLAKEKLNLSGNMAKNKLRSAYQNYLSAQKRLEAAQTYERLIGRGFKEGVNTYIETLDARSQLTQAELALSISRYKMLSAAAELEFETAGYSSKSNY